MITLDEYIEVWQGNIEDAKADLGVDTIVNAARPNLMGATGNCVDAAIHKKIDVLNNSNGFLKKKIREQLDKGKKGEHAIRCERGSVVETPGYKLCKTLLHTVGPKCDNDRIWPRTCSCSAVSILKSCYRNITQMAFYNDHIKKIAIPVISSGNYGFPFELAFKIAISEVYNTLLDIKKKDKELLEYTSLKKIYFVIPNQENYKVAQEILVTYKRTFKKERWTVARNSLESQMQLLKQIQLYDLRNGYFTITKFIRYMLVLIRIFLFPINYLKDLLGKEDWEKRRTFVEVFAIFKVLVAVGILYFIDSSTGIWSNLQSILMMYGLLDTITYLLALIILADIQNPSANIIRSLFMLFINYIEIVFELTIVGFVWLKTSISKSELLMYVVLGIDFNSSIESMENAWFMCMSDVVKFFFVTLVFGYFANHLRQRKFRND